MSGLSIIFDDKKIKKTIFYRSRKPFDVSDINVNRIVMYKEVVYGTNNSLKYFIGNFDEDDVIRLLLLKLPQMMGYLKEFNDSMIMSLRVDDSKLFKKYCKIWKTIRSLLGIEFDSEPVYGDTDSYIKTKVKIYDNKVNTNFQGKKTPKGDSSYKCLSSKVVLLNILSFCGIVTLSILLLYPFQITILSNPLLNNSLNLLMFSVFKVTIGIYNSLFCYWKY